MKPLSNKVSKLVAKPPKTSEKLSLWSAALALLLLSLTSTGRASQSSIEAKSGYNSLRQFSSSLSGTWGFSDKAFADVSLTDTRTPAVTVGRIDNFTQGSIGAGYSVEFLGFDAGLNAALQPLEGIHSIGGYFGVTYFHIPGNLTPDNSDETGEGSLSLLHTQTYIQSAHELPVFWTRIGYAINSITSDLLDPPDDGGKDSTLTVDGYYSVNEELVVGAGAGLHFYDEQRNVFKSTTQSTNDAYLNLLTSTVLGFPKTTITLNATWQIAVRDSLLPRYQATEIETSRIWTHTIDLGWRHQFTKHLFLTPTYELTFQADLPSTGLLLGLLYAF